MEWVAAFMTAVIAVFLYHSYHWNVDEASDEKLQKSEHRFSFVARTLDYAQKAIDRQDYEDAAEFCNQVLLQQPNNYQALMLKEDALRQLHQYADALEIVHRILRLYPNGVNSYWLVERASIYQNLNEPEKAQADIDHACVIEDFPEHLFVLLMRMDIYNRLGRYEEALQAGKPVIQLANEHTQTDEFKSFTVDYFVDISVRYAYALSQQKDFTQTLIVLDRALQVAPEEKLLLLNRSIAYMRTNNIDRALHDVNEVIRFKPDYVQAYNSRGWYLSLAGNYSEAVQDLHKAIELDPAYAYSYGSRGHAYFLMGKYPEAQADFAKQLELKPDHTFAFAGQAIVHHAAGNIEEARSMWRRLIELDARYQTADTLVDDYHPAEAFVNEARKLVAGLNLP